MNSNTNCPKCNNPILKSVHFHEPDHMGIQAVIYHGSEIIHDLFGCPHERFTKPCFITESEYQKLNKVKQ